MHRSRWAIAGLSLCLCACATSGQQHVAPAPAPEDKLNGDFDQGKVATVNRWALDHGATVIWTHYPQKRKGTDGG
jgi:hypothetical protein